MLHAKLGLDSEVYLQVIVGLDDCRVAGTNLTELVSLVPAAANFVLMVEPGLTHRANCDSLWIFRIVAALSCRVALDAGQELVHLGTVHR